MSFTVEDFHDLIELLAQHPEWRAELRRHVLSDELIELPSLVRQLVEAQARAADRLDRVEAAIERLTEAQARTEAAIGDLALAQQRTDARMDRMDDRLGSLDGKMHELDFARQGPSYLYPLARRLRVIESGPLADLLDDAVDEGRLTEADRQAIMLTDTVLTGRRRTDGQDVYLLVEVSVGVGPHDVERAVERATRLTKLGRPVLPVVAGSRITERAAVLAREQGVWYAEGGKITPPRST